MPKGKIGIFLPGQNGDIMSAMSVLKYKDDLWPGKDVIWYCSRLTELLKYNDAIVEVRHWPEGWGLPERCELENQTVLERGEPLWADFSVLKTADNRLDQEKRSMFELTADLDDGYFPTPWMCSLEQRHGLDYPNVSRKVFGVDFSLPWHPYLGFSKQEMAMVEDFCMRLPHKRTIMLETTFGSGVAKWDDQLTLDTIRICREKLGDCNFIFASAGDCTKFVDDPGVVSCAQFTVRQTALVNNYSDLFVGISSGISVATSCWGNKPTPKIQYCGSFTMSTVTLANGPIDLIVTDPAGSNHPSLEQKYPPDPGHRETYKAKLAARLDQIR